MNKLNGKLLLELIFRQASIEAVHVWGLLTAWLFDQSGPEQEMFIERVIQFAEEITGSPIQAVNPSSSAGDRLLQIVEKLEDPSVEKRQLAVLYYAMAIGLSYLHENGDEGSGAGIPASPPSPPRGGLAYARLPVWDSEL